MNHAKPEKNKDDYFEEDPMTVMAKLGNIEPAKHQICRTRLPVDG